MVPAITTATEAGAATLPRPKGAGPPVAASGMGTSAALDNPLCRKESPQGEPLLAGYGRFDSTIVGGGPVCVKAWKDGADNGGATWQGVTKDKITVIAVLPNDAQLETELAKAKIPNFGFSATAKKSNLQAPYRWGPSDAQSSAINSAEVIGKQLVGKKAEFAGGDVKGQTRKFGAVYIDDIIDLDQMKANFKK